MNWLRSLHLVPPQASSFSAEYDWLALFLLVVSTFFTLVIFVLIVIFALVFRRRAPDEVPAETKDHPWLEMTWIVVPLFIALVMFGWGAALFDTMRRPPNQGITINVTGKQWMWQTQQPDGSREKNELHVPLGVPIRLLMTSQDVIHDFAIPAMRIKQDVLPGRLTEEWFTATHAGEFELFCSEYCGTEHSQMRGKVTVLEPQEYQSWLAAHTIAEAPASSGARLFVSQGCQQCHGQIAPSLAGVSGRQQLLTDGRSVLADEDYIRESILNPSAKIAAGYPPIMPTYAGRLTTDQLFDLIAYIKQLGDEGPSTRPVSDALINQPPAVQSSPGPQRSTAQ